MKAKDMIKEMLEYCDGAKLAIETKGNFNGFLETIDCMVANDVYCEDCDDYHTEYSGYDLIVEDGIPSITERTCDSDGNWDYGLSYTGDEKVPEVDFKAIEENLKQKIEFDSRTKPCPHCVECGETPNLIPFKSDYCKDCIEHMSEEPYYDYGR